MRKLFILFLFCWSTSFSQTGLEAFNYSEGDGFYYWYEFHIFSGFGDVYQGSKWKFRIVSETTCGECYQYFIEGVKRDYNGSSPNNPGKTPSYRAVSFSFNDTLYVCPQDTTYWKHFFLDHLKVSYIEGIFKGDTELPSDETILGGFEIVTHDPTDFSLSSYDLYESDPIGTIVGDFVMSDPDFNAVSDPALVPSCDGNNDNHYFKIKYVENIGFFLISDSLFNFNFKNSYRLRIKAKDEHWGTITKDMILNVNKGSRPEPKDITLSNISIRENLPGGTFVGKLSVDPPMSGHYTYYGYDFFVREDSLFSSRTFDFEEADSIVVRIKFNAIMGDQVSGSKWIEIAPIVQDFVVSILDQPITNPDVFPNPTTGFLTISSNEQRIVSFELYSGAGQFIQKSLVDSNFEYIIDIQDKPPGIYLLYINNEKKRWLIRVVKE